MRRLTAQDPETKSDDPVARNIGQLQHIFSEAFTEGRVDFEVLKQLLGGKVDEREEKYGLNWHGKRRARQFALTPSAGTLRPCPLDSVDWDTTRNLMIEGDNLEVLKLLQKSYAGKVKLIYIDPPYNTGKDFVYPDNFQDSIRNYLELTGQSGDGGRRLSSNTEASGRYHTDWLNMIFSRLMLARNLLHSQGVIFINIDDTEQANLKLVCDTVFGEENFVANIIWQKKFSRQNDAEFFSTMHDHILCYAKATHKRSGFGWSINLLPRSEESNSGYSNPDNDPRGPWTSVDLTAKSGSDSLRFELASPTGVTFVPPNGRYWSVSKQKYQELIADNRLWFGKDGSGRPRQKTFLSEVQAGMRPNTIWFHSEVGHNQEARQSLKELFDGVGVFDSPKPVSLIRHMLQIGTESADAIILDFFAGSGSTGHAVMSQNAADGGNRRFILVQLPEPLDPANKDQKVAADYCDSQGKPRSIAELTKERLRRAGARVRAENPMLAGDLGFRVYKLDSTNIQEWEPSPKDLEASLQLSIENLKTDRSTEDILSELLLKLGLDLCVPVVQNDIAGKRVYAIGGGVLMVCLERAISSADTEPLALGIADWLKQLNPAGEATCIFRDSAFENDVAKSNLVAILEQHGSQAQLNLKIRSL